MLCEVGADLSQSGELHLHAWPMGTGTNLKFLNSIIFHLVKGECYFWLLSWVNWEFFRGKCTIQKHFPSQSSRKKLWWHNNPVVLIYFSDLLSSASLSHCVNSWWLIAAPAPSSSRKKATYRFIHDLVAGGKSNAPLVSFILSPDYSPTHVTDFVPTCPPPSAVFIRKGSERQREQQPLYCPLLCLQKPWLLPLLLFLAQSLLLYFFLLFCLTLSCLSLSWAPWENLPVWILLYLCDWSEGGWGRG